MVKIKLHYYLKGLGYSIFVMGAISLIIIYLTYNFSLKMKYVHTLESYQYRGVILKQMKDGFERDLPRSMEVAFKRALLEVINNETYEGVFYENIKEKLYNLSLYGGGDFLINNTITDYFKKYREILSFKNLNFDVYIHNYSIEIIDYDRLKICFNISYIIIDTLNEQGYSKTKEICSRFTIYNFEDPYITIKSQEHILSSFRICPSLPVMAEGDPFYGISYKPPPFSYNLSSIANKSKYVLVVEDIDNYIGIEGFRGYILPNRSSILEVLEVPYAYNLNISLIPNSTYIVVYDERVWITDMKYPPSKDSSCYFGWEDGINFLDRLKGSNISLSYGVSLFINTDSLPPYLLPSYEDTEVIIW